MVVGVALYLISAICAFLVGRSELHDLYLPEQQWQSYAIYTACLACILLPAIIIKRFRIATAVVQRTRGLVLFLYCASIAAWYSALYQLPFAYIAMKMGAMDVRSQLNSGGSAVLPHGPLTTIAVAISYFYIVYLLLFFLAIINKFGRFIVVSMFVGGISFVISMATFSGRTGVVLYMLGLVFVYGIFRDELSVRARRRSKVIFVACLVLFASLFAYVTAQRFYSGSDHHQLAAGTLGYLGIQPYSFAAAVVHSGDFAGLHSVFPVFFAQHGLPLQRTLRYQWTFGTFLSSFYGAGGLATMLVLVAIFTAFFAFYFVRRNRYNELSFLLLYALYFQFISGGVFYYMLGSNAGNIYIIIMLVLFYVSRAMLRVRRRSAVTSNAGVRSVAAPEASRRADLQAYAGAKAVLHEGPH